MTWNGTSRLSLKNPLSGQLINYDKNNTPEEACAYIEQNIMIKESFNPERMRSKSQAAPNLPLGNYLPLIYNLACSVSTY